MKTEEQKEEVITLNWTAKENAVKILKQEEDFKNMGIVIYTNEVKK